MKTEEYKSIEDLLDRFFEGQTSNEEERVLYKFFARPDIPAHLERYREVFGYFESGIALDFSETPELRLPAKEISYKRKIGWAIAVCVAASLLLFLVNTVFMNQNASFNPYEGSYIVRNGVVRYKEDTTRIGGHIPSGGSDGEECGSALKKCG